MAGNFVLTKDNVLMSPNVAARTGKPECTGWVSDDYEIECPHCKMKIKASELEEWVGCDACNDGECWLVGQLKKPNDRGELTRE